MQLGYWALLLPAAQLGTAAWLMHRVYWRRYVTLIPALLYFAAANIIAVVSPVPYQLLIIRVLRSISVLVWCIIAAEVFRISCVPLLRTQKIMSLSVAFSMSLILCMITRWRLGLTFVEMQSTWRQWVLLFVGLVLLCLWLYRSVHPSMENDEHYAYRTMFTLHALRNAIAGTFFNHGIADMMLGMQLSGTTWRQVDTALWILSMIMWPVTGYWMGRSYSTRLANILPRRGSWSMKRKAAGA